MRPRDADDAAATSRKDLKTAVVGKPIDRVIGGRLGLPVEQVTF